MLFFQSFLWVLKRFWINLHLIFKPKKFIKMLIKVSFRDETFNFLWTDSVTNEKVDIMKKKALIYQKLIFGKDNWLKVPDDTWTNIKKLLFWVFFSIQNKSWDKFGLHHNVLESVFWLWVYYYNFIFSNTTLYFPHICIRRVAKIFPRRRRWRFFAIADDFFKINAEHFIETLKT